MILYCYPCKRRIKSSPVLPREVYTGQSHSKGPKPSREQNRPAKEARVQSAYHRKSAAQQSIRGKRGGIGTARKASPIPHTTHNLEAKLQGVC
jgi:hypothetical protein